MPNDKEELYQMVLTEEERVIILELLDTAKANLQRSPIRSLYDAAHESAIQSFDLLRHKFLMAKKVPKEGDVVIEKKGGYNA